MAEIILTTVRDVIRVSTFNGNIDPDKIVPIIIATQDEFIQSILGTNLYQTLLDYVEDDSVNNQPIPEPYATLLAKYVTPLLSYRTASTFVIDHAYMIANGGVTQHQPDNAITPSLATIDRLSQRLKYRSNHWLRKLQDYLCSESNLFQEYCSQQVSGGMYPDSSNRGSLSWVY